MFRELPGDETWEGGRKEEGKRNAGNSTQQLGSTGEER